MSLNNSAQGTFPFVEGGDTMVTVSDRSRLQLHSVILKQSSPVFARLLKKAGPILSSIGQRKGIRYNIVLQNFDTQSGEEIPPIFRRVDLNADGQPLRPSSIIYEDEERNMDPNTFKYFYRVLGSYFNVELKLEAKDIASLMKEAVGLFAVAEYMGSVPLIAKSIDNALLSVGQELHRAIATSPLEWIDLAYRISSAVIFKEALIHVVGRYQKFRHTRADADAEAEGARNLIDTLREPIRDVVELKARQLQLMCQEAEQKIMTFYPPQLQRQSVTGRADRDDIGRQSYSTDIFHWMALSLYRHWFSQAIINGETHLRRAGNRTIYERIHEGGMAYLDRDSVASFHELFPMSLKGRNVVFGHLEAIKVVAKDMIEPILRNESNLDTNKFAVNWLTCLRVEDGDLPWNNKATPKPSFDHDSNNEQLDKDDDKSDENDDGFDEQ